jgi:hypothetical protein
MTLVAAKLTEDLPSKEKSCCTTKHSIHTIGQVGMDRQAGTVSLIHVLFLC